ncbi:hypothetical protein [Streptantibioticus ferralitis]|uniref:Uncharacterized protein n=1 Tax=Streptantibioticus ferralitis TaxID=236510 RepID=A0ABT5YUF8_9ACTN|nr:hypothetical protein [Streptantibioticus ferralitis]MDF2254445.1 hypothetical protein [Streptantibioticus ferralitis]
MSREVLVEVRYAALQGESWPEGHRADRAHEVDLAVELVMASGAVLAFDWAMDGLNEGLAIELRGHGEQGARPMGEAVDVSNHVEWARFLGKTITDITPVWHVPNEGCVEMPWSFRLDFCNSSSVVIALGESKGGGFTYMPDSLVVIFEESMAAAYKIPASSTSSLG